MQQRARQAAVREREEAARRKDAKKCVSSSLTDARRDVAKKVLRDTKLLSFGADEDGEEELPAAPKKKSVARPDRK